jgi:hypothetical protein
MDKTEERIPKETFTYEAYIRTVNYLVSKEMTSGPNQTQSLANYTKLNYRRMVRLNKTITIDSKLVDLVSSIPANLTWVVITEAWCGDAAQNIPYIAKLAEACPNVELKLVWRDENIAYIDRHLTNGSRSIPKLIVYDDENGSQLLSWGPRPRPVQEMVMEYKSQVDHEKRPFDQFAEEIHLWYAKDKNETLSKELLHIFQTLEPAKQV